MEVNTESILLQEGLISPAFLVANGIITQVNEAAKQRQITVGTPIDTLIATGHEEYRTYTAGKLYLQLAVCGTHIGAYVTKTQEAHLFCMESPYEEPELRALALAAQHLRDPLNHALINTEALQHNPALQEDPAVKSQLGQLNRGLYQLLRTVCNMSDTAGYQAQVSHQEYADAAALFDEILEKASHLVAQAGRKLVYKRLRSSVQCAMDADFLSRAILNLISNAIKFSPADSTIKASLQHHGNTLRFTIENSGVPVSSPLMQSPFNQFLREPGIEDSRYGIGLGMAIVRQAATSHGGTVLFDGNKQNGAKIIMTISTSRTIAPTLRSPIRLIGGYTGGLDNVLIELADVLPDSAYEPF